VTAALDATPLTVPTGGVARYTGELARALAQRFPDDQYWLVSDQVFSLPREAPPNLRAAAGPRNVAERRWWLWGLHQELARRQADVFHGTDFSVPYRRSCASVMTLHDLSPWLDPLWQPDASRVRRRTPRLLRWGLADMVITPSEAVRRAAIDRFALDADRVVAVPLGPLVRRASPPAAGHLAGLAAARPPADREVRPTYFLFVGTLEPRKNIARLLEAWRALRDRTQVELWLAGRLRADFGTLREEPGLRLLGIVPDEDLPRLYSEALAVVYPSLYEGFGLPVLEAMQCGSVVITSRDPAILEVTGGDAALHVEAQDTRALAEAMLAVARAPENFAALSERATARAALFSWSKTAERTREVYDAAHRAFA
jgi:glycosyltransferase involved in cell wall biosynthesis